MQQRSSGKGEWWLCTGANVGTRAGVQAGGRSVNERNTLRATGGQVKNGRSAGNSGE